MITPLGDVNPNFKENYPEPVGLSKQAKPLMSKTKPFGPAAEKRKRAQSKASTCPTEPIAMDKAFDRLLVCEAPTPSAFIHSIL